MKISRCFKVLILVLATTMLVQAVVQEPRTNTQTGSITGTVQTMDGKPAAGLRVSAMSIDSTAQSSALMSIGQTDASGRFKLENVSPGRYYIVAGFLDLSTYFPGAKTSNDATVVTVGPQAAISGIDFRMAFPAGLKFSGRVIRTDAQGGVIPAAPAGATGPPFQLLVGAPSTQLSELILQPSTPTPGVPLQRAPIAPDGTFEIANVRPGTYQINPQPVAPSPNARKSVTLTDADVKDYELTVEMMAQVQMIVTLEGGGPVPRFQLELSATPARPSQQGPPRLQGAATSTTRLQLGEYKVSATGLPVGFVFKSIKAGNADLLSGPLKVTPTDVPQIAVILGIASPSPWVSLSGRVVGRAQRQNVINMNINNTAASGTLEPVFYLDGTFEVPMTLAGEHRIRTGSLPSYGSINSTSMVGPSGSTDGILYVLDDAEIVETRISDKGVRVAGRISGHARLYAGSRVRLRDTTLGETWSSPIFMDGTFAFTDVPPGSYLAEVFPAVPGATPATVSVGLVNIRDLQIAVPNTPEISGRVSIPSGSAMPREIAFSAAAGEPIRVPLNPDGSFRTVLPDGQKIGVATNSLPPEYAIESVLYGGTNLNANPFIYSGKSVEELRVTLTSSRAMVKVSGRVTGLVATSTGIHVWLVDSSGRRQTQETGVNTDGAFIFAGVAPGSYVARVVAPGGSAATMTRIEVSGSDVTGVELPSR